MERIHSKIALFFTHPSKNRAIFLFADRSKDPAKI